MIDAIHWTGVCIVTQNIIWSNWALWELGIRVYCMFIILSADLWFYSWITCMHCQKFLVWHTSQLMHNSSDADQFLTIQNKVPQKKNTSTVKCHLKWTSKIKQLTVQILPSHWCSIASDLDLAAFSFLAVNGQISDKSFGTSSYHWIVWRDPYIELCQLNWY